jgi:hypothetical protein
MGYKASDLLQSNGIIWVEGPSDRVYLNTWLTLVAPDLVEGTHYSVAFYGGKVLAHFTAAEEPVEDLVQVLRINRNAVVMMDRDGDDETAVLNKNKKCIQEELVSGFCWVTRGREVENYLPQELIARYLATQSQPPPAVRFGPNQRLDKVLSTVTKPLRKTPLRYDRDKVGFAREFCRLMVAEDLNILDLRAQLESLVGHIRRWNQMSAPAPTTTGLRQVSTQR